MFLISFFFLFQKLKNKFFLQLSSSQIEDLVIDVILSTTDITLIAPLLNINLTNIVTNSESGEATLILDILYYGTIDQNTQEDDIINYLAMFKYTKTLSKHGSRYFQYFKLNGIMILKMN